jgi:hypothetical protein
VLLFLLLSSVLLPPYLMLLVVWLVALSSCTLVSQKSAPLYLAEPRTAHNYKITIYFTCTSYNHVSFPMFYQQVISYIVYRGWYCKQRPHPDRPDSCDLANCLSYGRSAAIDSCKQWRASKTVFQKAPHPYMMRMIPQEWAM